MERGIVPGQESETQSGDGEEGASPSDMTELREGMKKEIHSKTVVHNRRTWLTLDEGITQPQPGR